MFRNSYDSDNTVFSPQGRLHQVEYALEAVKQGSAAVGLRSKTHVVLLALKRSTGELASYQKKLIRIDDHIAVAIAGLTSDARVLSNFMRQQAMSSRMLYARPIPVSRVVSAIADKAQVNTQHYGRRPYGVGFLVAGHDSTGPHLYEFAPSGNCFEYYAMAIGARSQSAKTYLERHYEAFEEASLEELVHHGLLALRESLQQDKELTIMNTSVGIIGPAAAREKVAPPPPAFVSETGVSTSQGNTKSIRSVPPFQSRANFHTIEGDDLKAYIDKLPVKEASRPARSVAAAAAAAQTASETGSATESGQTGPAEGAQPSSGAPGAADDSMQTD